MKKIHYIHFNRKSKDYSIIFSGSDYFPIRIPDNPEYELNDLVMFIYDTTKNQRLVRYCYRIDFIQRKFSKKGFTIIYLDKRFKLSDTARFSSMEVCDDEYCF